MKRVLIFTMNKVLIASGDSFTAPAASMSSWAYDKDIIFWPELLAEKLEMDCINVGKGGVGNEFIYNSMVDALSQTDNVGLAICLWSHFDRWDFGDWSFKVNPKSKNPFRGYGSPELAKSHQKVLDALFETELVDSEYNLRKSIRWFKAFQNFCLCNDISFLQAGAFYPLEHNADASINSKLIKSMFMHPLYDSIKTENFLGWPIISRIGGFSMSNQLTWAEGYATIPKNLGDSKYRIGNGDYHPNQAGHDLISEIFYDQWLKRY